MNALELKIWLGDRQARPLVMGILNVTPDSFSDGGEFMSMDDAIRQARQMIEQGADLLDIGGESTRPGADRVAADAQIARVVAVIREIRRVSQVVISIDTTLSAVAEAACDAGAGLINDISAGREDAGMLGLAARRNVPIVLMHMLGVPGTMQQDPIYQDVTGEVCRFLRDRAAAALAAGVPADHILIDPGIGFGKNMEHNLQLLHDLPQIGSLGYKVVLGTSRKRFIGTITGVEKPQDRVFGSTATVAWGVTNQVAVVRVHDVGPTVQTIKMLRAII